MTTKEKIIVTMAHYNLSDETWDSTPQTVKDILVESVCPNITDEQYRAAAQDQAVEGEIEVDDNAVVSRGDDAGAYVAAWLWVANEQVTEIGAQ